MIKPPKVESTLVKYICLFVIWCPSKIAFLMISRCRKCESERCPDWLCLCCRWKSAVLVAGPWWRQKELLGRLPSWSTAMFLQPGGELCGYELLLQLWCWYRQLVWNVHFFLFFDLQLNLLYICTIFMSLTAFNKFPDKYFIEIFYVNKSHTSKRETQWCLVFPQLHFFPPYNMS